MTDCKKGDGNTRYSEDFIPATFRWPFIYSNFITRLKTTRAYWNQQRCNLDCRGGSRHLLKGSGDLKLICSTKWEGWRSLWPPLQTQQCTVHSIHMRCIENERHISTAVAVLSNVWCTFKRNLFNMVLIRILIIANEVSDWRNCQGIVNTSEAVKGTAIYIFFFTNCNDGHIPMNAMQLWT